MSAWLQMENTTENDWTQSGLSTLVDAGSTPAALTSLSPERIIERALSYNPRARFVGMSGGDDSLVTTHWMMSNVPDCQVFHANTGIGIERTRQFVRDTCKEKGWPLVEIRAKEDCGQDYDADVIAHGFPGEGHHYLMYSKFKERCVRVLVRRYKKRFGDKILIATGVRRDESVRRMGYDNSLIRFEGAQMWVNPLYYWSKQRFHDYIREHGLKRNPVSEILGFSGECLCGAFAHPGEKALVRIVEPETAERLDALECKVRAAGHSWGWEEGPPTGAVQFSKELKRGQQFMPFCVGCTKAAG